MKRWLLVAVWMGLAWSAAAQSADDGRALYERGALEAAVPGQPAPRLSARAGGDGGWVLRGAAVACANCHGLQADGGGEGSVRAPGLRWPQWSSLDPQVRAQARARLQRALREGIAADGRRLAGAMPRFDLDGAQFDALAQHIQALATADRVRALPHLALLRMADASDIEREIQRQLQACLAERLQGRAVLEQAELATPAEAARQWREWQGRPELVAALAPVWRGWHPEVQDEAVPTLPALFPLTADPSTGAPADVHWLFGGAEARAVALLQTWLQQRLAPSALAVWVGRGRQARALADALDRIALVVQAESGQALAWLRLEQPALPPGMAGLWLDETAAPPAGWWLLPLPLAAVQQAGSRWWRAHPYPGTPPRALAQRWAEAACWSTDRALADGPPATRAEWSAALARQGRLRAEGGWEWQLPRADAHGYGAATAWTVLEFNPGQPPRVVQPLVAIGRPGADR